MHTGSFAVSRLASLPKTRFLRQRVRRTSRRPRKRDGRRLGSEHPGLPCFLFARGSSALGSVATIRRGEPPKAAVLKARQHVDRLGRAVPLNARGRLALERSAYQQLERIAKAIGESDSTEMNVFRIRAGDDTDQFIVVDRLSRARCVDTATHQATTTGRRLFASRRAQQGNRESRKLSAVPSDDRESSDCDFPSGGHVRSWCVRGAGCSRNAWRRNDVENGRMTRRVR